MLNLNKIWKLISEFIGPLCLVVAVIIGVQQCNRAKKAEDRITYIESQITSDTELSKYTGESGSEHAVFKPNITTPAGLKNSDDSSLQSLVDTVSKELNIAANQITEITKVNSTGSFKSRGIKKDTVIIYRDTTVNWVFDPRTNDLDFNADLDLFSAGYTDGIKLLGFNIGTENVYTDMWWRDKRIKINSVDHIKIVSPLPKNTFDLSVNSEYRFNNNSIMVGPEAQFNISKWSFGGKYLYNLNTGEKEPSAGIKFYITK